MQPYTLEIVAQEVRDYWDERLKDGLEVEDVKATIQYGLRKLSRYAFEFIPGDGATAKANWVREQAKKIVDGLSIAAQGLFAVGLATFAGPLIAAAVKTGGYAVVDWAVDNLIAPAIHNAYLEEAADPESPVISDSLEKALVAAGA